MHAADQHEQRAKGNGRHRDILQSDIHNQFTPANRSNW
jgi:hypothetical protein